MNRVADRQVEGASDETDLVVVGSGAAGLTAALTAALKGLRVTLVEKADVVGGTTAISGGMLWVPCSPTAQRIGIRDSLDAARLYMKSVEGDSFDEQRTDNFLRAGPEMVGLLENEGGITFTVATDRPDYYSDLPGGSNGGRSLLPTSMNGRSLGRTISMLRRPARETTFLGMMMSPASDLRHFMNAGRSFKSLLYVIQRLAVLAVDFAGHGRSMKLGSGNALVAHLMRAALKAGVNIRVSTAGRELLRQGGRVCGLLCDTPAGPVQIRSRYGVILAAGGFPHDLSLRAMHYSHPSSRDQHVSPAPASNTGDGIQMALRIGGHTPKLSDACCWAPVSVVPHDDGTTGAFPHLIDRQKPGFIAVTREGQRFVNESHSYHEFGRGLIKATQNKGEPSCFLVADHRAVRQFGIGFAKPAPLPLFPYLRSGYLIRANSIRELAQRAGIDPQALVASVEKFNAHARKGEDPEFGRGTSPYNRYLGSAKQKPNPCVAPIEVGPFYAVKVNMGELGTFAGLATNANAQVIRSDGNVIEGLYAAGNDMSHVMGGNYLAGGAAIGPAMTFGYIAASHVASEASKSIHAV